jgi:hypothetical protein
MTPVTPLPSALGTLFLALAAALLEEERPRRIAAAGLLVLGLALAAWLAGTPPGVEPIPPERLGQGFLVGNGGLLLVGLGLICSALLRAPRGRLRTWALLLAAPGIVLFAPVPISFVRAGGALRALACALGLWLVGVVLVVGVRRIPAALSARIAARLTPPPLSPVLLWSSGARRLTLLVVVGLVVTLAGRHLAAVFGGVMLAAWTAWLASHPSGARPLPVAPTLTLLLIPAAWLLVTIAGPVGLRIAALPQVPLSPAAELLLTPALLLAGWATAGLWPLQRQLPGALLAPAGALLLACVAHPLVSDGLEYWRPLTVPLLVLGLWNAASWGRWPLVLAGGSLLAVAGGTPVPVGACAALQALAFALELRPAVSLPPLATILVRGAAWALVTVAGVRVLEEVLRGEVVYTALCVIGLAQIVAGGRAGGDGPVPPAR